MKRSCPGPKRRWDMLETIWFALWGILWAVYFVLDGFDLGIGTLAPFVAKNEDEKRAVYNSMGPYWNGNEVWLITAGGVTFAAFPKTYAVMFSSLYSALLLILFCLIVRGVAMEFRSRFASGGWKRFWDALLWIGNFGPALLFGVAFANLFRGILIDKAGMYQGTLFSLLNPYGLMGGILFTLIFRGARVSLAGDQIRGALRERAGQLAGKLWFALAVVAVVFLGATYISTGLYDNYLKAPVLFVIPLAAVARSARDSAFYPAGTMAQSLVLLGGFHPHGYAFRGLRDVSESAYIQHRSGIQPDGVQLVIESPDIENHARSRTGLRAGRHRLPNMGVQAFRVSGGRPRDPAKVGAGSKNGLKNL